MNYTVYMNKSHIGKDIYQPFKDKDSSLEDRTP